MPIVGALPFTILDGQPVVASPVMANFNFLASQINANIPPLIPSTTNTVTYVATVGGTQNAITLTPTIPLLAYAAGVSYRFKPIGTTIAGGSTVNVSGLGTRALLYSDGTPLTGFELRSGQEADIFDNGANFVLASPPSPSDINVSALTITFGGASVGVAYSQNVVTWCKIGRVLYYIVAVVLTNKGTSVGNALVEGLPFAPNAAWGVGVNQVGSGLFTSAVNFASGYCAAFLTAGITKIALVNVPTGGGAAAFLTNTNFANNSQVYISGSYIV